MKYLRLVLCLSIAAFLSHTTVFADTYDSETATIQKSSATMAKVMIGSKTFMAPISFADGASWDSVKDHYEVDPAVATGLEAGKMGISVGSDGTASFKACAACCTSCKKK